MARENFKKVIKVLVVGQTPPPIGGQAIMIQKMLEGDYGEEIQLFHVRMAFSRDMDEIGRFRLPKVIELLKVILAILVARFRYRTDILYYPPAGPTRMAVLRDIAILCTTRWLFRGTIFHFHAGGLSDFYLSASTPMRVLCRLAYFHPDVAIRLSQLAPEDGKAVKAGKEFVIPNGIEDKHDCLSDHMADSTAPAGPVHILFVGVLSESKGVTTLLEAGHLLAQRGLQVQIRLMGRFESIEFERRVRDIVAQYELWDCITFLGVLEGIEKWEEFAAADIFCFPTYFESETFGVVLLEAMSFGLPIVATQWRGIPSVVEDGISGLLVRVKDSAALAEKLDHLCRNPEQRRMMGRRGRERYLEHFTLDRFYEQLKQVFRTTSDLIL